MSAHPGAATEHANTIQQARTAIVGVSARVADYTDGKRSPVRRVGSAMTLVLGSPQWHAEAIRIWEAFVAANPPGPNADAMLGAVAPNFAKAWWTPQYGTYPREAEADGCREHLRWFQHPEPNLRAIEARRLQVLAEIEAAFDGVSREDGVTLHEAGVIDDYGSDVQRAAARALDTETRWQDADLATWSSVLSFLDDKGFRYYVPAYLCWELRFNETTYSAHNEDIFGKLEVIHDLKVADDWIIECDAQRARERLACLDLFGPAEATAIHSFFRFAREDWELAVSDETLAYWGRFRTEGHQPTML